jgi:hypothetical protein
VTKLRGRPFFGVFGTLNDGEQIAALPADHSPFKDNIDHDSAVGITKRPGRSELARIGALTPLVPTPVLVREAGTGSLPAATYYVRLTWHSIAGETSDLFAKQASLACQVNDTLLIWAPFPVKNKLVTDEDLDNRKLTIASIVDSRVQGSVPTTSFDGWLLFCRAPHIQDSTSLGLNPERKKLYDRRNYLGKVTSFNPVTS